MTRGVSEYPITDRPENTMKKILLTVILTILSNRMIFGGQIDKPVMEIQTDLGMGFYLGSFRAHLSTDGAYTLTPTLDLYLAPYICRHFGFQVYLGGGTVIHPQSEPIEGVIFYYGIGPFFIWDWGRFHIKIFGEAGYQNPNMSLQWYGSGFFEIGGSAGWALTDRSGIRLSLKYKRQFLRSLIIYEQYDSLEENDNLNSLSITFAYYLIF